MEMFLSDKEIKTLKRAVDTYGIRSQEDVAIEEMSELTKAIIKHRRYNTDETRVNILEEIIDTQIMLIQLTLHYGIAGRLFSEKIDRLKNRLDEEDEKEEKKAQPTTNFDLIKNMNLDEMADMFFKRVGGCDFCARRNCDKCVGVNCKAFIKKYLESEVKPDE